MSWVYFIQHGGPDGAVKIGTTRGNPYARMRDLQTGAPEPLRLLGALEGDARVERALHEKFAALRVRPDGEWFRADAALLAFIDGVRWSRPQPEDSGVDVSEDDRAVAFRLFWQAQDVQREAFLCLHKGLPLPMARLYMVCDSLRGIQEYGELAEAFDEYASRTCTSLDEVICSVESTIGVIETRHADPPAEEVH